MPPLPLAEQREDAVLGHAHVQRFGVGEHHRSDFVGPAPSILLAAAAAVTGRIRPTSSVSHPVDAMPAHTPVRESRSVTLANIAIYVALIIFVIYRRMVGHPLGPVKRQFALPVILILIGWGDATKGHTKPLDVTFTIVGCAISLVLGLARGRADRLSERDGAPYVQWTGWSVGLFAANLVIKLVLDLAGVAAGETAKAAGSSLLVALGLTLLGEAAVLWFRSGGAAQVTAGPPADYDQPRDQGDPLGAPRRTDTHDHGHDRL